MSDNWEVKQVEKSGNGFWINVQPANVGGDSGPAHIVNILILSITFMSWFGTTGFGWWLFFAVIAGMISVFLYLPALIFSLATIVYFIFW